jgi:hypothetical protein
MLPRITVPTSVDLVETFNYLIGFEGKRKWSALRFKLVTGENLKVLKSW